jgi:hypothetical protein
MGTSIIMSPTFAFATIIDFRAPAIAAAPPAVLAPELDESEIAACTLAAIPRCGIAARKKCSHNDSCKS